MWFIGMLLGMLLGSLDGFGEATLWGAMIGALGGAIFGHMRRSSSVHELAVRLDALERQVQELRAQQGVAPTSAAAPAPVAESSAVATDVPTTPDPFMVTPPSVEVPSAAELSEPAFAQSESTEPAGPPQPNIIEQAWNWLTGGNALVRIGVIVLFFGVAFLLKYAYDHTRIPVEVRLIGVAIGAIVMLAIGWRLRESRPVYGLAMQGGGVGLLYLVVFGAFRLFHLLPGEMAFALFAAIAVLSAALAVLQNAMSLAVLGVSGGFLAPILASTGGGSHVALFSYYAMLNAGVLGVALFKAWRPLNVLGFAFTFGIGTLWGARFYRPEFFASTEPFLVIFYLQYLAIAVLFAFREAPNLRHYVDGTIVFGVPLVAFGLQARLVKDIEYGAAWSAVALAATYLVLAWALHRRHAERLRMLVEAFLALGVIFATLAIPLAFDGRWTSAAWALEGAAAYWVGARQARRLPRIFGLLLQLAAGVAFLVDASREYGDIPIANSFFLGCVFISFAALFSNRTIERHFEKVGHFAMQVAIVVFAWGLAWWLFAGLHEIERHVPGGRQLDAGLLFLAGTCAAFSLWWKRGWVIARYPALALGPVMLVMFAADVTFDAHSHPFAGWGWAAWPVALALHLNILKRHEPSSSGYRQFAHAAGFWILAAVGGWEVGWQIDAVVEGNRVWQLIGWALFPGALLALVILRGPAITWPVAAHPHAYLWHGAGPVAAFLLGWTVYANFTNDGNPAPLPYVPLLNPLDLAQAFAFLALALWWRLLKAQQIAEVELWPPTLTRLLMGGAIFLFLNGVLLRTIHHWTGIPYALESLLRSDLVQVALSIFWTVLALAAMVTATRRGLRVLWSCGAALMGVVVVKLFLLDLAKVGGVERIVLFIAVGVLMLVIGYFSPLPPKEKSSP